MSSTSLPGATRPVAARRPPDRAEQAIAALDVEIPQVDAPAAYAFAMGSLVAWLAVVSLLYLAVVAFFGYLCAWHVTQAFGGFALFHVPMAIVGALVLLFLVKPLFLRAKKADATIVALTPEQEPTLFAFVEKLCEATGSPVPATIEIDCEPNAGARLDGWFSGRVVLRLGLPLVAALNARQFAGVLAHEFGHFNQRGGMRASTLVRTLAHLFARIVFQRDRLDAALLKLRFHPNAWARLLYRVAAALIESARGVLWVMLVFSELLTNVALRRMEYDADCREAHVAGTKDFIITGKLLAFLSIATRRARHDLAQAWDQQRLADDYPKLVVANARQLAEHRAGVIKLLETQTTGWFDTHPCHADRVRNVERLGAEGAVKTDASAKRLFADFEGLCRVATRTFYSGIIGEALATAKLVPTAELVGQRLEDRKAYRALHRFFQGRVIALRPIFPDADAVSPADDVHETAALLVDSREAMGFAATENASAVRDFEKSGPASAVFQAQLTLCSLYPHGNASVQRVRRLATRELKRHEPAFIKAANKLPTFELMARDRLTAAIRLIWTTDPAELGKTPAEAAAGRRQVADLVTVCGAVQSVLPTVSKLRDLTIRLRVFYGAYNPQQPYGPLVKHLLGAGRSAIEQLAKLRDGLSPYPYPFEHVTPGISIGAALVPKMPDHQNPADTHAVISATLERFYTLTFRTLARLTDWAERIETSLGLSPLDDPPDEEDEETKDELAAEGRRKSRRYWLAYGGRALAGVAMLWCLVWLSVSPPSFHPSGGRGSDEGPAPFRVPFRPAPQWTPPARQGTPWLQDTPMMPEFPTHNTPTHWPSGDNGSAPAGPGFPTFPTAPRNPTYTPPPRPVWPTPGGAPQMPHGPQPSRGPSPGGPGRR